MTISKHILQNKLRTFYHRKHVLVCGGAGFIGSHIVDFLTAFGAEVTVIDPCMPGTGGNSENLSNSKSHIRWHRCPIEDVSTLHAILQDSDLVIDAMGFTRHHEGMENPRKDLELNYLCHLTLIDMLNQIPKPAVYLGSRGQYGRLEGQVDESYPQVPLDPQGVHKSAAESMFRIYSKQYGWNCISVRIGNCFGPRQLPLGKDIGLIGGFIRSILNEEAVELYGDANRTRYLIYVEDLALQLVGLVPNMPAGFTAMNLMGESILIKDILDLLIKLNGKGDYRWIAFPEEIAALEPGEAKISQEALYQNLEDISYTPFYEAIEKTFNYLKGMLT